MLFRKMSSILLILTFAALPLLPEGQHHIQTSRGEVEVVLPEGMTYEEAFLEMSRLYWEEKYASEDLAAQLKKLVDAAEEYETTIRDLLKVYKKPKLGVGLEISKNILNLDNLPMFEVSGELLLSRTISVEVFASTKLDVGLGISYFF